MGKFVKGQIANPNGRPKAHTLAEIRSLARKAAPEMVDILMEIARDDQAPHAARAAAANHVLDRGYGKPAQMLADEDGNAVSWFDLLANAQRRANIIDVTPTPRIEHDVN